VLATIEHHQSKLEMHGINCTDIDHIWWSSCFNIHVVVSFTPLS
jgi:hypothetical protein